MSGWRRSHKISGKLEKSDCLVSVLVPVRNEETTITNLLLDIASQTYAKYEVLVINDHSTDNTVQVVMDVLSKNTFLNSKIKLLHCTEGSGKKAALTLGVQHATGEIIITTDADCRLANGWISSMAVHFSKNTQLVVGMVRLSASTFFEKLQQLEFASLIGSGVATLAWNYPTMANGANFAFRQDAFIKVSGYSGNQQIPSGDDEFLLRKIKKYYPDSIRIAMQNQAVVESQPANNFREFLQQRLRWASKWSLHEGFFSKALAIVVFTVQLAFLVLPWLVLSGGMPWQIGLLMWLTKFFLEYLFIKPVTRELGVRFSWTAFLVLQFIYPYYVVSIALLANRRKYTWKGRTF